ncbi:MAG: GDP-mannose 4,6-dehydratase [Ardenticatenaceae bacterium]
MRVLITGVSGFAGSHLADFLLDQGDFEVWGTYRSGVGSAAHLVDRITLRQIDLIEPNAVHDLLAECQPERIYHLAGQAFVAVSWKDPWPTLENNIRPQLNLLQAMVNLELEARILCVTSMKLYGQTTAEDLPIDELTPLRPDSPYAVSKLTQDMLCAQYFRSYGLYNVRARPFNHIGPRQNERFVASSFAKQIAEIECGLRSPVMHVGNLAAQRDFSDVRDMVRAYYLLLEHGEAGEAYNLGRGEPNSVQKLLDLLLSFTEMHIDVRVDRSRLRPSNVPVSYADTLKLRAATNWAPQISFEDSLRDVLDYWRRKIRHENG